jgi:excisionase family DNA binding protein
MSLEPLLTTEELAARWRCTRFTVSRLYKKLEIKPVRVGKRLLFRLSDIEAAERRQMTPNVFA